ncbi:reverse transcriptase domain-containing protein [Tanacetum coccineum]
MSFGLKNAGATYQRLVDKAFEKQIGRNLEVYVDDLVIKSHTEHEILRDINEAFRNLRRINMKLNPKKYTFGAEEGAFLGHVVSMKGIKACPEKVEAVMKLRSPQTLKEAQSLNGKLASLNRFLSKSAKKSLPFFKTLKRPMTLIRAQILADFFAERPDEEDPPKETPAEEVTSTPWTLFTDGSSCLKGPGSGLILTSPEGEEFTYALRFEFDASNNEAEYEALIAGLWIAEQMEVKNLVAKVDSRLVANQINGPYKAKEQSMIQYLEKAKALTDNFKMFSIEQVLRSENKKADALSKISSTSFAHLTKYVLVEILKKKSIEEQEILVVVEEEGHCWMTSLIEYLAEGPFPEAQGKVRFLIVAIDYFTKFGLLGEIISDNEKQFRHNPFKDWCEKLNIKQRFMSVKHPQTNGQVERGNRNLG